MSLTKSLKSFDGESLHCEIHEIGAPIWILVTHGLNEHLGRHPHIKDLFAEYFNLFFYDLRGHGQSTGKRSWVREFEDYSRDLRACIQFLQKFYGLKRYFLFGHSMGGLITCDFLKRYRREMQLPERAFLSSPLVGAPGLLGPVCNSVPPKFFKALRKLPGAYFKAVDIDGLSHRASVKEAFESDPLTNKRTHLHLLLEVMRGCREVFSTPLRYPGSLYASIGTGDRIVNVNEFRNYFSSLEKKAKLQFIQGGLHELHFEPESYRAPYFDFLSDAFYASLSSPDELFS